MMKMPKIPDIPAEERTPVVEALLVIIHQQQEQIHLLREQVQALKDEVARLKGQKPRPKIKPSTLEKGSDKKEEKKDPQWKRPGSVKRSKTRELEIHEIVKVSPDNVPEGSRRFKGYDDYTVQGIVFRAHNTLYRLECWETPVGQRLVGKLPPEIQAVGGHFSPDLVSYILYQSYQAQVTQPLLLEQLWEIGIDISAGQLNRILTEGKESFHAEKGEILRVGLKVSSYVNVDDTGARHQGKNGYCTHIGNELFTWFASTESKSRINFLQLLRAGHEDYVLGKDALYYMRAQGLPQAQLGLLEAQGERVFADEASWKASLEAMAITSERHVRIATEGALLGSVLTHGVNSELAIMSDDAGQFNVLLHALCWIHAERTVNKLVGFNDEQRAALEAKRTQIWDFYAELKRYKQAPMADKKAELDAQFDEIFTEKTCFVTLNQALNRLYKNKAELLLVLDRPDLPLHNNESERDIREYVKKRKISGSTRSALGRRCRDTFASLKKTCRKLGVSFWEFLKDRLSGRNTIPQLPDLILKRAEESPS
ncbi:MAG: IS66 family transposase [Planctomycetota bacterium]